MCPYSPIAASLCGALPQGLAYPADLGNCPLMKRCQAGTPLPQSDWLKRQRVPMSGEWPVTCQNVVLVI